MPILLFVMDPVMHGWDCAGRLDKILEIPSCRKVVSMEGNRSPATATLQTGVKKGAKNKPLRKKGFSGCKKV